MAKRLSAMFSLSKDDSSNGHDRSVSNSSLSNTPPDPIPHFGKLSKRQPMAKSPSLMELKSAADGPLPPPPLVTDSGVRSATRDAQSPSRAGSPSTRNSSGSRPQTPELLSVPGAYSPVSATSPTGGKVNKRKSWLPGRSEKQRPGYGDGLTGEAWIAGLKEHVPYDMGPLLRGERVTEMWDEAGDVIVSLFPEGAIGKGPSFRVCSNIFTDSRTLAYLCQPSQPVNYSRRSSANLQVPGLPAAMENLQLNDQSTSFLQGSMFDNQTAPGSLSPTARVRSPVQQEKFLQLPLGLENDYSASGSIPYEDDLELIVLYRNFFSFLAGGALISTPRQNSLYSIFMGVSSILKRLQYGNDKGSSWGTVPWSSFSRYTDELRLADVRASREKNIEALILGEAMKSWPLYNEGFAHAVGRLDDIKSIKSPKWSQVSATTLNRLERANLDLQQRLLAVKTKLDNFEFPSMFSGIANSQTSTEARLIRFKAWKQAFLDFRTYTMTHYKRRYGAWPPKASSKKNNFEESGLNRLLLREVYQDFTDLYDMLVDREQFTTRSVDIAALPDDAAGNNETIQHALRVVEGEYDRSTPPVLPPIPFDVPLLPMYANSFDRQHVLAQNEPGIPKKLKDNEINALLLGSYNRESIKPTLFCQEFLAYEREIGKNKSVQELNDHRCGQWLFIYAVLQSLPMLVVDARDLKYTDGVEHFLCEAPRGGRPWMKEDTSMSRAWYNVANGGGMISLPADLIDHSVEGIYRRSHCYQIANIWAQAMPPTPIVEPRTTSQDWSLQSTATREQPAPPRQGAGLSPYLAPVQSGYRSSHSSPHTSPFLRPTSSSADDPGTLSLPSQRSMSRSSMRMGMGLEEVAAPTQAPTRPVSILNPNITFDDILGANQSSTGGKRAKKDKKK